MSLLLESPTPCVSDVEVEKETGASGCVQLRAIPDPTLCLFALLICRLSGSTPRAAFRGVESYSIDEQLLHIIILYSPPSFIIM